MNLLKYSLVKFSVNIYTFQYYHKIGIDIIKVGELVYDALYLIPVANIKQWYTSNE